MSSVKILTLFEKEMQFLGIACSETVLRICFLINKRPTLIGLLKKRFYSYCL